MKNLNLPKTLAQEWEEWQTNQKTTPILNIETFFRLSHDYQTIKSQLQKFYEINVEKSKRTLKYSVELRNDVNWAARWVTSTNSKPSLIINGDNGNGKTTLANAICDLVSYNTNKVVLRIEAHEFSRMFAIGATEYEKQQSNDLMKQLMNVDRLLIDDMGKDEPEYRCWGTVYHPLELILTWRHERRKCTILTTNLTSDEIETRYGKNILERIKERYNRLGITRPSYR